MSTIHMVLCSSNLFVQQSLSNLCLIKLDIMLQQRSQKWSMLQLEECKNREALARALHSKESVKPTPDSANQASNDHHHHHHHHPKHRTSQMKTYEVLFCFPIEAFRSRLSNDSAREVCQHPFGVHGYLGADANWVEMDYPLTIHGIYALACMWTSSHTLSQDSTKTEGTELDVQSWTKSNSSEDSAANWNRSS